MSYELAGSASDIGDGLWRWFVWVEGESLEVINEVVYTLDPSFPKPVRRTKDRSSSFKIDDIASSSFTVYARANLVSGNHIQMQRSVHLDPLQTTSDSVKQIDSQLKPIIMAIDDDAGVLEAVSQDLRRHYGRSFKIVTAQSGGEALEKLRELKALGKEAALILADQRMPNMQGVDFLAKSLELFPKAKRVLLTAYADAETAIRAMNTAKADYYLNKPWDPPEDKLYPVLDDLLCEWVPKRRR